MRCNPLLYTDLNGVCQQTNLGNIKIHQHHIFSNTFSNSGCILSKMVFGNASVFTLSFISEGKIGLKEIVSSSLLT